MCAFFIVVLSTKKDHPKLIVLHPPNHRLPDVHGLWIVGKPELQSQARSTGEGRHAFDSTAEQRQVHEQSVAVSSCMSIYHPPVHGNTRMNSFGHSFPPSVENLEQQQ
jgi:hypothetical protein